MPHVYFRATNCVLSVGLAGYKKRMESTNGADIYIHKILVFAEKNLTQTEMAQVRSLTQVRIEIF